MAVSTSRKMRAAAFQPRPPILRSLVSRVPVSLAIRSRLTCRWAARCGQGEATFAPSSEKGGTVVGRVQAGLGGISGGGKLGSQLSSASLSGGIRYNGPAGVLFSFAALPDQFVSGPIGVAADFSGRVGQPQLVGLVRSQSLTYLNETYGTKLTNVAINGRFTNDRLALMIASSLVGCHKVEKFDAQFSNLAQDIEQRQNAINHDMATSNALAPMPADSH